MNETPENRTVQLLQEARELQKSMGECFADLSVRIDRLTRITAEMLPPSLKQKD